MPKTETKGISYIIVNGIVAIFRHIVGTFSHWNVEMRAWHRFTQTNSNALWNMSIGHGHWARMNFNLNK